MTYSEVIILHRRPKGGSKAIDSQQEQQQAQPQQASSAQTEYAELLKEQTNFMKQLVAVQSGKVTDKQSGNISRILNNLFENYDKRLRPNYKGTKYIKITS